MTNAMNNDDLIRTLVAAAPPLTVEQVDRIRAALTQGGHTRDSRPPVADIGPERQHRAA